MDNLHQALLTQLKARSFKTGDFTLSSGQKSTFYLDARTTTLSAQGSRLIGEILVPTLVALNIKAVGGLTMGADPVVSAVTVMSEIKGTPIDGFLIRKEAKEHGTGRQIEGCWPVEGPIALVEDVTTTGASFKTALEAIRATAPNAQVVQLISLVDRREHKLSEIEGIPFQAVFPIEVFMPEAALF